MTRGPVNCRFEYVWLDGYSPTAHLRSKTKVLALENYGGELGPVPEWSFDGSSTEQAEGHSSDCLLQPVAVYRDTTRKDGYLVVAEVLNADGTPHDSNTRSLIDDDDDDWFGFEQEYVLTSHEGRPIGFPAGGFPPPQGPYYCAVGSNFIAGRSIVEEHLDICLEAGLGITGINAEVMLGQWEYQCFGVGAKKACDDLVASRYLLHRVAEHNNVVVNIDPKPIQGDWNGSGLHTNFSNNHIRDQGGEEYIAALMDSFQRNHEEHIRIYGDQNELRLTGAHETASIEQFSYGASDRGASIRIPISTVQNGWKGYLEDRRPASNADPYRVAARIIQTVKEAEVPAETGVSAWSDRS